MCTHAPAVIFHQSADIFEFPPFPQTSSQTHPTVHPQSLTNGLTQNKNTDLFKNSLSSTISNTASFVAGARKMFPKGENNLPRSRAVCDVIDCSIKDFQEQLKTLGRIEKKSVVSLSKTLLLNVIRVISLDDISFINNLTNHVHQLDKEAKALAIARDPRSKGAAFAARVNSVKTLFAKAKEKCDDPVKAERISSAASAVLGAVQQVTAACVQNGTAEEKAAAAAQISKTSIEFLELLRTLHEELFNRITEGREEETMAADRVRDIELLGITANFLQTDASSSVLTGLELVDEQLAVKVILSTVECALERATALLDSPYCLQNPAFKVQQILAKEEIDSIKSGVEGVRRTARAEDALQSSLTLLNDHYTTLCSLVHPFNVHCTLELRRIELAAAQAAQALSTVNYKKALEESRVAIKSLERLCRAAQVLTEQNIQAVYIASVQSALQEARQHISAANANIAAAINASNMGLTNELLRGIQLSAVRLSEAMTTPKNIALFTAFSEYYCRVVPFLGMQSTTPDVNRLCALAAEKFKALDTFVTTYEPSMAAAVSALSPIDLIKSIKAGNFAQLGAQASRLREGLAKAVSSLFDAEGSKSVFAKTASVAVEELHCELYRPRRVDLARRASQVYKGVSNVLLIAAARVLKMRSEGDSYEAFIEVLEAEAQRLCTELTATLQLAEQTETVETLAPHLFRLLQSIEHISAERSQADQIKPADKEVVTASLNAYAAIAALEQNPTEDARAKLVECLQRQLGVCKRLSPLKFPSCGFDKRQNKFIKQEVAVLEHALKSEQALRSPETLTLLRQLVLGTIQQTAWCVRVIDEVDEASREWTTRMANRTVKETLGQLGLFAKFWSTEFAEPRLEEAGRALADAASRFDVALTSGTAHLSGLIDEDGSYPFDLDGALAAESTLKYSEQVKSTRSLVLLALNEVLSVQSAYCNVVHSIGFAKELKSKQEIAYEKVGKEAARLARLMDTFAESFNVPKSACKAAVAEAAAPTPKSLRKRLSVFSAERVLVKNAALLVEALATISALASKTTTASAPLQAACARAAGAVSQLIAACTLYRHHANKKQVKEAVSVLADNYKVYKHAVTGEFATAHAHLDRVAKESLNAVLGLADWEGIMFRVTGDVERCCVLYTSNKELEQRGENGVDEDDVLMTLGKTAKATDSLHDLIKVASSDTRRVVAPEKHREVIATLGLAAQALVADSRDTENVLNDIRYANAQALTYLCDGVEAALVANARVCEQAVNEHGDDWSAPVFVQIGVGRSRLYRGTTTKHVARIVYSAVNAAVSAVVQLLAVQGHEGAAVSAKVRARLCYLCYLIASDGSMPFTSDTSFDTYNYVRYLNSLKALVPELVTKANSSDERVRVQVVNAARAERAKLVAIMPELHGEELAEAQALKELLDAIVLNDGTCNAVQIEQLQAAREMQRMYSEKALLNALANSVCASKKVAAAAGAEGKQAVLEKQCDSTARHVKRVRNLCNAENGRLATYAPILDRLAAELENCVNTGDRERAGKAAAATRLCCHRVLSELHPNMQKAVFEQIALSYNEYQLVRSHPEVLQDARGEATVEAHSDDLKGLALFFDNYAVKSPAAERAQKEASISSLEKEGKENKHVCMRCAKADATERDFVAAKKSCGDMQVSIMDAANQVTPFSECLLENAVAVNALKKQPSISGAEHRGAAERGELSIFLGDGLERLAANPEQKHAIHRQNKRLIKAMTRYENDLDAPADAETLRADLDAVGTELARLLGKALTKEVTGARLLALMRVPEPTAEQVAEMEVLAAALEGTTLDAKKLEKIKAVRADITEEGFTPDNVARMCKIITGSGGKTKAARRVDPADDLFKALRSIHKETDALRAALKAEGAVGEKDLERLSELHSAWCRAILGYADRQSEKFVDGTPEELRGRIEQDNADGVEALNALTLGVAKGEAPGALVLECTNLRKAVDASALRIMEPEAKARETLRAIDECCTTAAEHPYKGKKYSAKVEPLGDILLAAAACVCSPAANESRLRHANDSMLRAQRMEKIPCAPVEVADGMDKRRVSEEFRDWQHAMGARATLALPISSGAAVAAARQRLGSGSKGEVVASAAAMCQATKAAERAHKGGETPEDKRARGELKQLRKDVKGASRALAGSDATAPETFRATQEYAVAVASGEHMCAAVARIEPFDENAVVRLIGDIRAELCEVEHSHGDAPSTLYGHVRKLEREGGDLAGVSRVLACMFAAGVPLCATPKKALKAHCNPDTLRALSDRVDAAVTETDANLDRSVDRAACGALCGAADALAAELLAVLPSDVAMLARLDAVRKMASKLAEAKTSGAPGEEVQARKRALEREIAALREQGEEYKASGACASPGRVDELLGSLAALPDAIAGASTEEDAKAALAQTEKDLGELAREILSADVEELYANNEGLKAALASGAPLDEETLALMKRQQALAEKLAGTGNDAAVEEAKELVRRLGEEMYAQGVIDDIELAALPVPERAGADGAKEQSDAALAQLDALRLSGDPVKGVEGLKSRLDILARVSAEKSKARPEDHRLLRNAQLLAEMYKRMLDAATLGDQTELDALADLTKRLVSCNYEVDQIKTRKTIAEYAKSATEALRRRDYPKALKDARRMDALVQRQIERAKAHATADHPRDQIEAQAYVERVSIHEAQLAAETDKAERRPGANDKELEQAIARAAQSATERSAVPAVAGTYLALDALDDVLSGKKVLPPEAVDALCEELYDSLERVRDANASRHPIEQFRKAAVARSKGDVKRLFAVRQQRAAQGQPTDDVDAQLRFAMGAGVVASHSLSAARNGLQARTVAAQEASRSGKKNAALCNAFATAALCDAEELFAQYSSYTKPVHERASAGGLGKEGHQFFTAARDSDTPRVAAGAGALHVASSAPVRSNEPIARRLAGVDTVFLAAQTMELLLRPERSEAEKRTLAVAIPQLIANTQHLAAQQREREDGADDAKLLDTVAERLSQAAAQLNPLAAQEDAQAQAQAVLAKLCEHLIVAASRGDKNNTAGIVASYGAESVGDMKAAAKETDSTAREMRLRKARLDVAAAARAVDIIGHAALRERQEAAAQAEADGKPKKAAAERRLAEQADAAFRELSAALRSYEAERGTEGAAELQRRVNRAVSACMPEEDFMNANAEIEAALGRMAADARAAEEQTRRAPVACETEGARRAAEDSAADALSLLAAQQGVLLALVEDEDDAKEKVALKAAADIIGKNTAPLVCATTAMVYDGEDADLAGAIARILEPSRKVRDDVAARRKRLVPEGMEGDEILQAAFEIEDYIIDNESERRTQVELDALDLSGLIQQLAIAAKANDRPRVLEIGKLIRAKVRELCKRSTGIVSACGHAPTVAAMQSATSTANNHGVQLAILCSVKAASEGEDPTMKSNLIKCAKEIAKAVVEMVKLEKVSELVKTKGRR